MPEKFEHLVAVILRTWSEQTTEADDRDLQKWLDESTENRQWYNRINDNNWFKARFNRFDKIDVDISRVKFWAKVEEYDRAKAASQKRLFYRAAAVLILVCGIGYFYLKPANKNQNNPNPSLARKDTAVKPGIDTAILELANGTTIALNTKVNGEIAKYGNLQFVKKGGQVAAIRLSRKVNGDPVYHYMRIPKGGQFKIILPDGSKVWLNSASSIRFPSEFSGTTRSVWITGEAYFDVNKDSIKPFVVYASGAEFEVLGTEFNLNAYAEEGKTIASLIKGRIKVVFNSQHAILAPNQSAMVASGQPIKVDSNAIVNKIIAWHNGFFDFHGDSLTSVARQLARWYDLNVVYRARPPIIVSFFAPRDKDINSIIEGLIKGNKEINIEISGKDLILKSSPLH